MLRGLYTATTAMKSNTTKLDVITNNIANMNTSGYKRDLVINESFPEVLISKINGTKDNNFENKATISVNRNEDTYQLSTTSGYFRTQVDNDTSHERNLRVAVNKDGYLTTFDKNPNGTANTTEGKLILGQNGPVYVGEGAFEITNTGEVFADGNVVDNILTQKPLGVIGTLNGGVKISKIATDFIQGSMEKTDSDLDMALDGTGFFKIETPDGIRYTRDGNFKINEYKELVTSDGYPVLGQYGAIEINSENVAINERGEIFADNEYWDTIQIVDVDNKRDMRKLGYNIYKMEEDVEPIESQFKGRVLQGFLEGSNVNPIKEMSKMIGLYRNYETNQRIVKAYDETLNKVINEVAKV